MRITEVFIENFKNLQNFKIDLSDNQSLNTIVVVGQNGAGKSNFLEALVLIFKDLIYGENAPPFNYTLKYTSAGKAIEIHSRKNLGESKLATQIQIFEDEPKKKVQKQVYKYQIKVDDRVSSAQTLSGIEIHLPKYVFAYYSGVSNRLEQHFDKTQKKFYDELLEGKNEPFRRLFYAQSIHSNYVLLAFYAFQDEKTKNFLQEHLNIIGFDSALFVIQQPQWYKKKKNVNKGLQDESVKKNVGEKKFWDSRGVVKDFLNILFKHSLAPIRHEIKTRIDFRHKPKNKGCWYLYIDSQEQLQDLATEYCTTFNIKDEIKNTEFFKALESLYISDLILETRIQVKKKDAEGNITFKELSEGEQQLLMVLGLLKFTKHEESLFLLDEPDTHLNPLWEYKYLSLLNTVVGDYQSSQMLISTHHALTIGGVEKEQIRVFTKNGDQVTTHEPHINPKGMSIDGILTSDIFGLNTTIDRETYEKLLERRRLFAEKLDLEKEGRTLSVEDAAKLQALTQMMSEKALPYHDPLFYDFILALKEIDYEVYEKQTPLSEEEKKERIRKAKEAFEKIKKVNKE
ncbi:MAG TPA: AAA family ATPase [Cytophagaceae bacterium]|jgi:predicted ATPase|nr:AAA family ATPase [Cytophagaceae bacterium]